MATFCIEIYNRDADGNPVERGGWAFDNLTVAQIRELEDALVSAANDYIKSVGLDRDGGIAATAIEWLP